MTEPLRVAILGAGEIARQGHLPGFVMAGAKITALCSRSNPALETLGQEYGADRCYYDWRQMLKDGGFGAVSICTPPHLHAEMTVESARRGYHVLVEKPMANTLAQCDRMIEAAAKAQVVLMLAYNQRFMAPHQQVKQILDSGRLGRPYLAHAVFGHAGPEKWSPNQQWYFDPDLAGPGVLADLGSHKLDLLSWLLGQSIVEIGAIGATFEKATTAPDSVACLVRFSQGTLATIQASWVFRPDWENSLVIRCERGVIRAPTAVTDPVRVLEVGPLAEAQEKVYDSATTDPAGWFQTVAAFVRAASYNEPSPVPGEQGKAAVAAVIAAGEAMAGQVMVKL